MWRGQAAILDSATFSAFRGHPSRNLKTCLPWKRKTAHIPIQQRACRVLPPRLCLCLQPLGWHHPAKRMVKLLPPRLNPRRLPRMPPSCSRMKARLSEFPGVKLQSSSLPLTKVSPLSLATLTGLRLTMCVTQVLPSCARQTTRGSLVRMASGSPARLPTALGA